MLIVEDNEHASGALRVLFEATGHEVDVAASLAEASAAISARRPQLVLLDLTLPDGDGLDLMETLRARAAPLPPVIATTGHDDPALAERCRSAGCVDVLVKPVPVAKLMERAREILGR